MTKTTSLYLDMMRGAAALAVFLCHSTYHEVTGGFLQRLGVFGDDAVMAFFVLSGYVIAFSAENKHLTLCDYTIARLARLWSVVLPALVLTALVSYTIRNVIDSSSIPLFVGNKAIYFLGNDAFYRYILSALFVNQIWFLHVTPGSDGPFWSLCYEAFYYAIYGAIFYLRGTTRWFVAAVALAIAGPRIALLLPLWLLGVLAYRIGKKTLPQALGWIMWTGSILALGLYYHLHVRKLLFVLLPFGSAFNDTACPYGALSTRYLIAIIIFVNILGFQIIGSAFSYILVRIEKYIRIGGRYSFSLYLYHTPLLILFMTLTWSGHGRWWSIAAIYLGTISGVAILAPLTESRKEVISQALGRLMGGLPGWRRLASRKA